MSDEQQRPGDAARGGSEPDETRRFGPSTYDENQPDGRPRSGVAGGVGRTEQMPRTRPADDETALAPRPDATSIMPATERDPGLSATTARGGGGRNEADLGAASPAWTGRAEVRPALPSEGGGFTTGDWDAVPPPREPRDRWWTPIVVGIVVLVLLALLGWGVWLIVQASSADRESPAPGASTSAAAPEPTEPTSAPPTTTTPTTTPSTTEPTGPQEVTVPALKGLSSAEARQALDRTGLAYRLRFVASADAAAGTVIDSDPAEGQQVPSDTTVTLIIAVAPSSAATATTTPTTTAPTDSNGQPDDN